jgi:hypothetical protein
MKGRILDYTNESCIIQTKRFQIQSVIYSMNNRIETKLEQIEVLRCPLCGSQINSEKYTQTMDHLKNKAEKMYNMELQEQKLKAEKRNK